MQQVTQFEPAWTFMFFFKYFPSISFILLQKLGKSWKEIVEEKYVENFINAQ